MSIIHNPGRWHVHYDYARGGMGMIFPFYQNWRTSTLPFSLALANSVNTGVSFNTPSNGIANTQWWASRGFQGYGPRVQYPGGSGMDGLAKGVGCHCGCGGNCGHSHGMGGFTMDGSGLFGTGIFGQSVNVTDVSTWTPWEWGTLGAAFYVLYSLMFTTSTKTRAAGERIRKVRKALT